MSLSTHILDATSGNPAADVRVVLRRGHTQLDEQLTNADGRIAGFGGVDEPGEYSLKFETGAYFAGRGQESFYPEISITFTVTDADRHLHVPILVSPFAFTTYRGS